MINNINIKDTLSEDTIKNYLEDDKIQRNPFLNSLLKITVSSEDGSILDLNGDWGSGKTVIVKSIGILSDNQEIMPSGIEEKVLNTFREDYAVFYFNAWENDQYDPAEAIIFQLIDSYWEKNEKIATKVLPIAKSFARNLLSKASYGLLNLDDAEENSEFRTLQETIHLTNNKRIAAEDIITNVIDGSDKKHMLFIIDELDRCNPRFAIKLLEVIKHYFSNGPVKVLFVTNNIDLSRLIENDYSAMSGYRYLDKIFDLVIDVPPVKTESFVRAFSDMDEEDNYRETISELARYYRMTLRETKRFITLFKMSRQYIESANLNTIGEINITRFFAKHLLLPLIIAAKIKNINDYEAIVSWSEEGKKLMDRVASTSKYAKSIIAECNSPRTVNSASSLYGRLIAVGEGRGSEDEENVRKIVEDMCSMINIVVRPEED